MNFKSLFSVEGRATRTEYWISQLIFAIPSVAVVLLEGETGTAMIVSYIAMLIMLIPVLFISIKRWHDLNKPGIYVLINLIPYIGSFITVAMQGFMGPVDEANVYGDNPRLKNEVKAE